MKSEKVTRKLTGTALTQEREKSKFEESTALVESEATPIELRTKNTTERPPDPHPLILKVSPVKRLRDWFITSTFTPAWLPEPLQHPLFGYVVAILLQVVAVLFTLYLDSQLQVFAFIGPLEVLAVALVALSWGVGPSVIATLVGSCLFNYTILPPQFSWEFIKPGNAYQLILLVLIGLAISIVASQTERARRRAERLADSLTKEHARLEAIIETVPDIVTIYDKRGRMTQMNEIGRHSKIFGTAAQNRAPEELLREREAFTLSGTLVTSEELPVARALRGETVESTEVRFFDDKGSERFVSISAAPMLNIRGTIDGVVSVTRDLSFLHQTEREAADRAMELEAIFQSLADGLFVVNQEGTIIRSNTVFQEIIGYTLENREQFMALSGEERYALLRISDENGIPLPFEKWPETRILKGEVLKGAAIVDIHLHSLNGRDLQLSVSGAPLYNREGKTTAALCICRDVTERRILEQRTHDTLDALLTMAEALVNRDEKDVAEDQNRTGASKKIALRMARLTSKVLDCPRASIFLADPAAGSLLPAAIIGFTPEEEESWWQWAEQLHLSIHGNPVPELTRRLRAGEIVVPDKREQCNLFEQRADVVQTLLIAPMVVDDHFIGLLTLGQENPDYVYTPENKALAGAIAHLLALVFERDRLLHEQAEARATELALRTANQHMEAFLGMVSHELKTPLTSIKGNTQLAVRQLRNSLQSFERIFGLYEAAEQQSRRLNRLVDDLLDVSRTRTGRLELLPEACDLRDIVHEVFQEQTRMWPNRTIELEMDEETPLPLEADADRVGQVISNYLTNALKYSDPDQPVLLQTLSEEQHAYLAVRDQGPGLSTESQERIWERFYRVPGVEVRSSSHTSQAGLGLGLYITKNIIEGQQGQVGVLSAPGKGSTFWFRLPLRHTSQVNENLA